MSTTTQRVGLTLWDPTDNVQGEEAWNANTRRLEEIVALLADVQQPFYLKSATHDSANNRLVLTIGPGSADFLGMLVSKTADTVYYITAPAVNTTYHLFIKSDGSFTHRTAAAAQAGEVRLWTVATGAAVSTITTTDVRGRLPGAAARKVADDLAVHIAAPDPHPQYATDTALGAHTGSTANPHNVTAAQTGALASVEGVSNPGGNIDLLQGGAITIVGNDAANSITISETHSTRTDNPHGVTAAQVGALVSLEGVSAAGGNIDLVQGSGITILADNTNKTITFSLAAGAGGLASIEGVTNAGGNVDLVPGGAILITGDNSAKSITITETHSVRVDNPHQTSAAQVGALVSLEGVSNPGGNIDLVPGGAISITGNDAANTITITETHSTRTDNPHGVTAAQTGALSSVEGVSNAGGNIDLVGAGGIQVVGDNGTKIITITDTHSGSTTNPHGTTAAQTGALVSIDGVSNPGGNIDLIQGTGVLITPNDAGNTITFGLSLTTAGGFELNKVAYTGANGEVGRAANVSAWKAGAVFWTWGGTPGGTEPERAAITDTNGRVGDSIKVGGVWVRNNAGAPEWSVDNANWNVFGVNEATVRNIALPLARRY